MQINDDYYEDLDKEKTLKILEQILETETTTFHANSDVEKLTHKSIY